MKTGPTDIRPPAVAGTFYPAAPAQLRAIVEEALDLARRQSTPHPPPKALIVPHAGYLYSGPIAASGFSCIKGQNHYRRVVLLGPAHYADFRGLALSERSGFATPLGYVPVDTTACVALAKLPQARVFEGAHHPEHCLEVELPFVQCCLSGVEIVPVLVGNARDTDVAEAIDLLWGGSETLFVISSDLSHFLDYCAAQALDTKTASSIEQLQADAIGPDQACGRMAIRGMLLAGQRRGVRATTIDLRNSGDTAGPRDRVVGYGAFAFG
jgi:AmmeMemoRadiSam system protein B